MRRILVVFTLVAIAMIFVFNSADWYATNAAMPRYCEKPDETIMYVDKILTTDTPSEGEEKRPYIVAAKLIFLVPQDEGEAVEDYLLRLRVSISEICGTPY